MSGSKDAAFLNDAKKIAGVDAFGNVHVLNTDSTGTLEVALTAEPIIDIGKVDQGLPAIAQNAWPVTTAPLHSANSDTFTGISTGTIYTPLQTYHTFAVQVKGTGATPSIWTVLLEGSIDGTNYTTILTHTQADTEIIIWTGTLFYPVLTYRVRTTALTLGGASNIVVTTFGTS